MTSPFEGEKKQYTTLPDSWIEAFIISNKTAPLDIFLERIIVGERIVHSIVSGEADIETFDDISPSYSQAMRLANTIDTTHELMGVKTELEPETLIDIWSRVYRHVKNSTELLGGITDEKMRNLARLYSSAVERINTSKSQNSAELYRASLDIEKAASGELFNESLLRELYESLYENVVVSAFSINNSGGEISEEVVKGFRHSILE